MKIANTLLGLAAGTALGVSLGVLFALDKGENTRKKIKDSVSDKVDDLKEQLESLTEKFREKSSDVKETLEEKVDKLLSESEDGRLYQKRQGGNRADHPDDLRTLSEVGREKKSESGNSLGRRTADACHGKGTDVKAEVDPDG